MEQADRSKDERWNAAFVLFRHMKCAKFNGNETERNFTMRITNMAAAALGFALGFAGILSSASATTIIGPAGGSGDFFWNGGLGPIDTVDNREPANWDVQCRIDDPLGHCKIRLMLQDTELPGDEFALLRGDAIIPADSVDYIIDGDARFFKGTWELTLAPGSNLISATLTALARCGDTLCQAGDGLYMFDNYRVPEPATLAIFGVGLAGLGFARRRKAA